MKKQIFSILLCLCMVLSLMPMPVMAAEEDPVISIGGVTVDNNDWYALTDASGTVTTGSAISANYNIHVVKGDVNGTPTATVTLKNATISNSSNQYAIKVEGYDLNIVTEGTSNQIGVGTTNGYGIAIYSSTSNKVTITGEGDLTLKGSYGINVNGLGEVNINTTGNLNIASEWQMIRTSGNITVVTKSMEATGYYFYGYAISLTATDGDIHSTGSGQYGISSSGDVTVVASNGAISISGVEYAIKATDYSVNVAAKNDVTLTGTVLGKEVSITSETGNLSINGYRAIEGAKTSVTLSAPSGDMLLNASGNNIITGSNNFTLAITAAGKIEAKGPYGIYDYGSATIKADKVSLTNTTTGDGFRGGALTITNPSGGNCSEVYVSGGHNGCKVINASGDVNIKADQVLIVAGPNANHAIYGYNTNSDVTVKIGDTGLIVGAISIKGTNAISSGILYAEKNGVNASGGLNLNTQTPTQSTYYKAGDGYMIFEPASGATPATLFLHNATIHNQTTRITQVIGMEHEGIALPEGNIILKVEGTNSITSSSGDGMGYFGSHVTLAGSGVLNVDGVGSDIKLDDGSFSIADGANVVLTGVVSVTNVSTSKNTSSVYGNITVGASFGRLYGDVMIASGASVTIPDGKSLWMDEMDSITMKGQLINKGKIILPYNYTIEQIKALNLTGTIWMYDGQSNKYRIYVNNNIYAYGGKADYNFTFGSAPTEVTYYETSNGYYIFTPASGETQAKLTLHNVDIFGDFTLPGVPLTFDLEGENTIEAIKASDSIAMKGSGKLDVYDFMNSNTNATLTVNSGTKLNTMYNTTKDTIRTNTIYGSYTLSEDSRFYVGSSQKLVLLPGSVFTLRENGYIEFFDGTTLNDMTIGAGASIVNQTYITLPQGTTPAQIVALPLSGTGVVRVTTKYDNHGYPETWDTYTNDGVSMTVVDGGDLTLTDTEVQEADHKGYTWIKSGEGNSEVWTLTLKSTCIDGSLYLPNKAIVIQSTADSIINGDVYTDSDYAVNITFTGTALLTIGGSINGEIEGDIVTIQGGAKVTLDGAILLGGNDDGNGTLNVTGTGTTLTVSSSYWYAVMCDSVNVQNGAVMTANAQDGDGIGVVALSGVSITGGSTLTAGCGYGIYIAGGQKNGVDFVGKLTMDESSKLITNSAVAPFVIVDRTSTKSKSDVITLAQIPSGTEITSVQGTDTGSGYTYWSLIPVGGSLNVTNEDYLPVTLTGAASGKLSFVKTVIPSENPGGNTGVNPGGYPGGSIAIVTKPEVKPPVIKGGSNKEGWEGIKEQLGQSKDGDTVTVEMNGSLVVPGEVFSTIAGRDINYVLDMGDGIIWTVNGQSIQENNLRDINFGVTLDTDAIPENLISQTAGTQAYRSISLSHDGNFGFTALLSVDMGKNNAGDYANLFYHNPTSGRLELQSIEIINQDGLVEYKFPHASDYVVVVSTEPMYTKALAQTVISTTKGALYLGGTKNKSMSLKLELPELLNEVAKKNSSQLVITYKSSNPKVATVTSTGKITAKKAGKTTITTQVKIGGEEKIFKTTITVSEASIKLAKSIKSLKKGETFTFQAKGYGVNAKDIMYYTSKKSIIAINKTTGKAVAKSTGTGYIIARAGKVEVKIKVTIK